MRQRTAWSRNLGQGSGQRKPRLSAACAKGDCNHCFIVECTHDCGHEMKERPQSFKEGSHGRRTKAASA